jgi:hypothetical protein
MQASSRGASNRGQAMTSSDESMRHPGDGASLDPYDFKKVTDEEVAYIRKRRESLSITGADLGDGGGFGLAMSGGGIRSAAFCIGAMQALEAFPLESTVPDKLKTRGAGQEAPKHDLFARLDYLSSVSGGGYAASTVSASIAATGEFPFPSRLNNHEPVVLRHIRDHSNYLFPRGFLKGLGPNLTIYLRGFLGHLPFFVAIVLFLVIITVLSNPTFEDLERPDLFGFSLPYFSGNFIFSGIALVVTSVAIYVWSFIESANYRTALNPNTWQNKFARIGFIVVLAAIFLEFQPYVIAALHRVNQPQGQPGGFANFLFGLKTSAGTWTGFFGGTEAAPVAKSSPSGPLDWFVAFIQRATIPLTALAGFMATLKGVLGSGEPGTEATGIKGIALSVANKSLVWLAGLAVPLLIWVCYLYLCYWAITPEGVRIVGCKR